MLDQLHCHVAHLVFLSLHPRCFRPLFFDRGLAVLCDRSLNFILFLRQLVLIGHEQVFEDLAELGLVGRYCHEARCVRGCGV